jgi:uncharacterized RmlC-like cupin family protein
MTTRGDAKPACRLVAAGDAFVGRQALTYAVGISAESVGARAIHMQIVRIPPRARAKAHKLACLARRGADGAQHRAAGRLLLHPGRRSASAL